MVLVKQNDPVIESPFCEIPLSQNMVCKVDPERFTELSQYRWTAKKSFCKWYAVRKIRRAGKQIFIKMHRFIAQTPDGMIPHHQNRNSLDNRRLNLLNMSIYDHIKMHSWR